ncbi:ABATE domain-containing protein [Lentzea sp. NPDC042327]|uniref:CGNR zinc finger domain-containing protein n=1 Tax=Lentzea sp. NPDC042327 TaxID=3154801 RepID=UPI0033EF9CD9
MSFAFVSGNLALDFLGTLKWRGGDDEELLTGPRDVGAWAVAAGLVTEQPEVTAAQLTALVDLRESVYRLVRATLAGSGRPEDDLLRVNSYADAPAPSFTLTETGVRRHGTARAVGGEIARAAAALLERADELVIRECGRAECTRIFIDRSRTGNRRWCDMEECGNRIKAAQYRARRRSG